MHTGSHKCVSLVVKKTSSNIHYNSTPVQDSTSSLQSPLQGINPYTFVHVQIRTCAHSVTVLVEFFSSCKTYIWSVLDVKKCSYVFVQKIFVCDKYLMSDVHEKHTGACRSSYHPLHWFSFNKYWNVPIKSIFGLHNW
jgi:hypothetical protein